VVSSSDVLSKRGMPSSWGLKVAEALVEGVHCRFAYAVAHLPRCKERAFQVLTSRSARTRRSPRQPGRSRSVIAIIGIDVSPDFDHRYSFVPVRAGPFLPGPQGARKKTARVCSSRPTSWECGV
jgi:hypothetical protein